MHRGSGHLRLFIKSRSTMTELSMTIQHDGSSTAFADFKVFHACEIMLQVLLNSSTTLSILHPFSGLPVIRVRIKLLKYILLYIFSSATQKPVP